MHRQIAEVFQTECARLAIDASLIKRLRMYESSFVGRNEDHIQFFGGHLLGVHPVKFLPSDRMRWFEEILRADELILKDKLYGLMYDDSDLKVRSAPRQRPVINQEWVVSSDVMNLSCAWLIHAIYTSKLDEKSKVQGMTDTLLILQYKFLTSLLFHYFRYPASKEVAEATYAALSDKFTIKQVGTWAAFFRARAASILDLDPDSPHTAMIKKMDDDEKVIYFVNDIQGRIRDVLKNIYAVFDRVHNSGERINTVSSVADHDGEKILKDKTKSLMNYTRYLNSVISDKESFIREDLVLVIEKLVHTAPPAVFRASLSWMSEHYRQSRFGIIEEVINECLVHSFAYFDEHRSYVRATPNLAELLGRLKGVYASSRSTDPVLMKLRDKMETLVQMAVQSKNDSTLASVRTALLLYLVARALTMTHYAG
jgi:hypothetical protein